jgi:tetratricopeptide (TPR) repeat protein
MKMRHAKILLMLFLILLISCKGGDKGRMIHLGTWDHEKYGTLHVKFLKKSKTLQNYPCKRGKVRFHNNGQILSFKTTGEVSLDQGMVPSGSRIYTYPGGKPEYVYLSTDTEFQGYKVSSRSRMLSWQLSLYCGGELRSFRSAVDLEIDGIPCSHKQGIELYPDGSLMSCHLSRAIPGKDNKYTAGTRIMMDMDGAPHSYSFPQNQAVSRLLNIEEHLSEPLVRAYEARLNGRLDSARSIARLLQDKDYRNPLIHYELARIKRHRFIGGGKQTLENMLYSSRHTWVDQYNVILAFFHAESLLFAVRNNIKAAEEYRVTDYYYEAINRFEKVLEMKPDYHAARLHLVDLYSHLPDNQGGDREKAEAHAKELLKYDHVWAIRAEAILLPEKTGPVDFWLRAWENFRDDPMALQELGRAYLYEKDVRNAVECFRKAMELEDGKCILLLDLARFHMRELRTDKNMAGEHISMAETYLREYLTTGPVNPHRSWCYAKLAWLKDLGGETAEGVSLRDEAKRLDMWFSRQEAPPSLLLFISPGELFNEFESYFRP